MYTKSNMRTRIRPLSVVVIYNVNRKKGGLLMSRPISYTQEQIKILEQNSYTHSVTPYRITFTIEFKHFFAEQMNIPGMTTPKILRAAGYDTSFFSRDAMDNIRIRIRAELESDKGFKQPRGLTNKEKTAQFAIKNLEKQNTNASIKELQEHIVHLEQQVEFLKKISHIRSTLEQK